MSLRKRHLNALSVISLLMVLLPHAAQAVNQYNRVLMDFGEVSDENQAILKRFIMTEPEKLDAFPKPLNLFHWRLYEIMIGYTEISPMNRVHDPKSGAEVLAYYSSRDRTIMVNMNLWLGEATSLPKQQNAAAAYDVAKISNDPEAVRATVFHEYLRAYHDYMRRPEFLHLGAHNKLTKFDENAYAYSNIYYALLKSRGALIPLDANTVKVYWPTLGPKRSPVLAISATERELVPEQQELLIRKRAESVCRIYNKAPVDVEYLGSTPAYALWTDVESYYVYRIDFSSDGSAKRANILQEYGTSNNHFSIFRSVICSNARTR